MKPDRRLRDNLNHASTFAIPMADGNALPARLGIGGHLLDGGQALAFLAWSPLRARLTFGRGFVQGRVQAQAYDQAELTRQLGQPKQPQNSGKFAVGDDDQQAPWQPAPQLHDHLPAPVEYL